MSTEISTVPPPPRPSRPSLPSPPSRPSPAPGGADIRDQPRALQRVEPAREPQQAWPRVASVALALLAVALFVASLSQPWWHFQLYAPQYPHGLNLVVSLSGFSGDVREIDSLNHYIGMGHLDSAAAFERAYAPHGVALLALVIAALALFGSRKQVLLLPIAGALFPLGFIADSLYWFYRFGHDLDPHAALRIPAFMPQLFGNGQIGQFMTFATPERGFWIALAGVGVLATAALAARLDKRHARSA